jgi:hypothetical protein
MFESELKKKEEEKKEFKAQLSKYLEIQRSLETLKMHESKPKLL